MSEDVNYEVVIVGAGVAGLSCARVLNEHGITYTVLEKSSRPGGRIKTDYLDGFQLDHGFQVLQTGYPGIDQHLNLASLQLSSFPAGVAIRHNGRFHAIADPRHHPESLYSTVFSSIGSLADRLRMLKLAVSLSRSPMEKIFVEPEEKTIDFLRNRGFSERFIQSFFTPFFAGASLDLSLEASSRVLKYVTRLFATGNAALPAGGMAAVVDQLAAGFPEHCLQYNREVVDIEQRVVRLSDGTAVKAGKIVIAVPLPGCAQLLHFDSAQQSVGETCLYFSAEWQPPFNHPFLLLNGEGRGPINNIAFPSLVSPSYAPEGKTLVAVVVLGDDYLGNDDLEKLVRNQCIDWFGTVVQNWQLIKTYRIEQALPKQSPPTSNPYEVPAAFSENITVCGEYGSLPGLQWAMMSGAMAGKRIVKERSAC